jgi:hypothetical protein
MTKIRIANSLFVFAALLGCGDSDPIDSTITPEYVEPIEAYLIDNDTVTVIEVTNPFLPSPRTEISTETILENITSLAAIDRDLSGDRDDERFPNDRGLTYEFFAYLSSDAPSKLFLYDASSRRNQVIFDLDSADNRVGDTLFCRILAGEIADIERLKTDQYEIKQELKIYGITATDNCDDASDLNYYVFNLATDSDAQYSVRQPVKRDSEDPDLIEYDIRKITYPIYKAQRETTNESFFSSSTLITDSQASNYGFLNYNFELNPQAINDTDRWSLQRPIDVDNTDTYQYWSERLVSVDSSLKSAKVLNPSIQTDDPYFIAFGNQLLKLSEREAFDLILEADRRNSLSTPVYEWTISPDADETNINILDSNSVAIIDGLDLKLIDSNGSESQVRVLEDVNNALIPSEEYILLKENDDQYETLSLIESNGTKRPIVGQTEAIQTFAYQNYFDYHMVASGGIDNRFVQSHDNGTLKFIPAIEDSAWMPLKNYLQDKTEQLILHADDTSGGVLRSPKIYTFDALENNGQGELKGMINADFAIIEEAAIIGERFGMIWVRESFDDDAKLKAYYFNPSDSEWSFTLVSDDTIAPDWLPFILP